MLPVKNAECKSIHVHHRYIYRKRFPTTLTRLPAIRTPTTVLIVAQARFNYFACPLRTGPDGEKIHDSCLGSILLRSTEYRVPLLICFDQFADIGGNVYLGLVFSFLSLCFARRMRDGTRRAIHTGTCNERVALAIY